MNQPQRFDHPQFGELDVLVIDNKEYFAATEVAEKLGYANPQKAIRDHCKEAGCTVRSVSYPSGTKSKRFINEGNLYRLIVKSKLPAAEQFEQWVFEDVLPSIRKHGGYLTPETVEQVLTDPDTIIRLATDLKQERLKRQQAEFLIEQQKPKVLFADAVETSESSILIGQLAKLITQNGYPIGQNRLFKWLRENGFLGKAGSHYNEPTQYAVERGWFEVKERTINNPDGSVRITRTTKVTGKGQIYFINKFLALKEIS